MNRLLIIVAFLFSLSAYAQNESGYALYSPKGTASLDSKSMLPVLMDNEKSICNLQFDITLPQGINVSTGMNEDEEETYLIEKGERAKSSHTISCLKQGEGRFRILISSTTNAAFKDDKTLPILNISLDITNDAAVGENNIQFTNIVFSNYDSGSNKTTKINVPDAVATIDILNILSVKAMPNNAEKGSVSISGETFDAEEGTAMSGDVVTFTATPNKGCIFLKWTEDGNDVSTDNPYTWKVDKNLNLTAVFAKYSVTADTAMLPISKDSQFILPLLMDNEGSVSNLQFDIELPEGFVIHYGMNEDEEEAYFIQKGERAKSAHTVSCNKQGTGKYRVVVSSTTNATFKDADQTLPILNITVDVPQETRPGQYPVKLSNVILAHYDTETNRTEKYNVPDAVSSIQLCKVYSIKATSNNAELGSVEIKGETYDAENSSAHEGSVLTLTANPAENCTFLQWVENGKELSADSPYTLTLTSDRDIQAVFAKYGDSNADGFINVNDITIIATYILKGKAEGFYIKSADINRDGFINVNDITGIAKYILTGKY